MGTFNRKVLTRNSYIYMDHAEFEQVCSGISADHKANTSGDDWNQKEGASNIPDIVSSISITRQSQDFMEDYKDPDIVRSNSSSDEKSLECQVASHRPVCRPKISDAGHRSVSSFSSSTSSQHRSTSSENPDTKAQRSAVGSLSFLDNDDLQQNKAPVAREGSWANHIYNPDLVFAQDSEDQLDGTLHYRQWQQTNVSRHIPSPIMETESLLTSTDSNLNNILRCSEKGQEARNRFSSSGYGTGSGESSQGTAASKTSVHLSQETFSKVDAVLQRGIESSTVCSEESKCVENILQSRAVSSNSASVKNEVNTSVRNMTKPELKPAFQNLSSVSRITADYSLSSRRIIAENDLRHFSPIIADGPSTSLESQTSEHRQQQAHKYNVVMNINPTQVERQSSVGLQNVRQSQLNTAPQNIMQSYTGAVPKNTPSVKHSQVSTVPSNVRQSQASVVPPIVRQSQVSAVPPNVRQSNMSAVPSSVRQSQASAVAQNIGQSQASLVAQRQSQIHISSSVIQTSLGGTSSMFITGLQPQPAPASNGKMNTAYADYHTHFRQLSIQQHPPSSGSLNYTTAPMSSSSSGSCFVPLSVEDRWTAETSPASLAKNLLQSGSGASESSGESRYHLESLLKTEDQLIQKHDDAAGTSPDIPSAGARHIPIFPELLSDGSDSSIWAEMYSVETSTNDDLLDRDLWKKLQISIRCDETNCNVPECAQIKKVIEVLQHERNDVHSLSNSHKNLLLTMFNHMVYSCDHPKCPFSWCGERIDNIQDLSRNERLLIMKQRMENFAEHCRLLNSPAKYMKLNTSFPYTCMPVEDHHWIRLCMMGSSRRTLLVKPSQFNSSDSDSGYWVIKKVSLTGEGDDWSVYSRLREVKHRSVVSMLWAASFEDHMLVCSLYEGFSLYDYLPSLPPAQCRFVSVFCIMQQLISAVRHVNSLGIVYLNWTSKNILVTYHSATDFVIKLSNFSCSVLLERPDGKQPCYDCGYLQLALPRHVVTPELRDNKVEFASDVWGMGCLLYELATGYPIWHEHRHILDQDFVKSLVGKEAEFPHSCPELLEMFEACREPDPSKRVPMADLEIMLIQAFSHHLGS